MFSLDWFLTPAGIFITLGVLLLVAALVIFLVTKNKGKKDKEKSGIDNMANAALNAAPPVDIMGGVVQPTVNPVIQPIDNTQMVQPVIDNQSNIGVGMPVMDSVTSTVDNSNMTQQVEIPNVYSNDSIADLNTQSQSQEVVPSNNDVATVPNVGMEIPQVELPDSINQSPVIDNQVTQPTVEIPNVYNTEVPTNTQVSTDSNSYVTPVVDNGSLGVPTVDQAMPEITGISMPINEQSAVTPEVTTSIYGGASPAVVPDFNQTPAQPQIYGGANPLENTQQVPIADITNNTMFQNNGVSSTPVVEQSSSVANPVIPNEANVAAVTPVQNSVSDYNAVANNFQNVGVQNNGQIYSASTAQAQIPTQNNIGQ